MKSPANQKRTILQYLQAEGFDDVHHLEKVHTEAILGRRHDVWVVHTRDGGRWWVVTGLTNYYSQADFKSMDVVLSFHLGLGMRISARQEREYGPGRERLRPAWRRLIQAAEELDKAEEAEDFQAVGMRCRECLLAVARTLAIETRPADGQPVPKLGDFVHWSEIIAETIAAGSGAAHLRSHLKTLAKETWQYVNWLTHATGAGRFDAELALDATGHLLALFNTTLARWDAGSPQRCPSCSSYRVAEDYRDEGKDLRMFTVCESCDWEQAGKLIDLPPRTVPPPPDTPHTPSSDISGMFTLDAAIERLNHPGRGLTSAQTGNGEASSGPPTPSVASQRPSARR